MNRLVWNYRWAVRLAALLLFAGFVVHPPLTAEGMAQPIWIPVHVMLLLSLVLLLPAYAWMGLCANRPSTLGLAGLSLVYLALCSFIGVVYFELMVIPTLAGTALELLDNGLRIGTLNWFLPLTGLSFVIAHFILGVAWWDIGVARWGLVLFMVGSIGVGLKPVLPAIGYIVGAGAFCLAWIVMSARMRSEPDNK